MIYALTTEVKTKQMTFFTFGTWSMDKVVEAVEPEVSKAEALDPEWFDEEFESRCLKSNH